MSYPNMKPEIDDANVNKYTRVVGVSPFVESPFACNPAVVPETIDDDVESSCEWNLITLAPFFAWDASRSKLSDELSVEDLAVIIGAKKGKD